MDSAFSISSLALLFYYSWRLALVAMALTATLIGLTVLIYRFQMPYQRAMIALGGLNEGLVHQMLSAIAKLRCTGSEPRMFARWAETMAEQKSLSLAMRRIGAIQQVIVQMFPILGSMALFAAAIYLGPTDNGATKPLVDMGDYLSFTSAYGQFVGALMAVTGAMTSLVSIIPLYQRVAPILQATPEVTEAADDPGTLTRGLDFQRVSFRYDADGPLILRDVSWRADPGDYIALVGSSGSGKSTVLRLLLGFETPTAGAVSFDGKDLAGLDVSAVRRQIGVVLQNGRLAQGSVFEAIIGSAPLTLDHAWDAARLAGLDQDIEAMPMGMHTVIAEGGTTLSGGQRQRLLIARALARRPRLLLFDEATSALDNRTQDIINRSLDNLGITRLIIAHRLSTIRSVNRVIVLEQGEIIEDGTPAALLALNGRFAALARRQAI